MVYIYNILLYYIILYYIIYHIYIIIYIYKLFGGLKLDAHWHTWTQTFLSLQLPNVQSEAGKETGECRMCCAAWEDGNMMNTWWSTRGTDWNRVAYLIKPQGGKWCLTDNLVLSIRISSNRHGRRSFLSHFEHTDCRKVTELHKSRSV